MKMKLLLIAATAVLFCSQISLAQAPSGSTGQCRDGSYTTAAKKSGACSGHKGVQTWFAASGNSAPTTSNAMAPGQEPTSAPVPAAKQIPPSGTSPAQSMPAGQQSPASMAGSSSSPSSSRPQAAGGGPGMVWVNTKSKVYHCPGAEFYGTTKNGKYMSEADALAMGARADHNKPCPK